MTVVLKYPSKCALCDQAIAAGVEVNWIAGESGSGFSHAHITCPDPSRERKIRERRPRQDIDHDELYVVRKCSRVPAPFDPNVRWTRKHMDACGKTTAFRTSDRVPLRCPYCDAPWVSGDPAEVAWAA